MIRVLIIEDEMAAATRLEKLLRAADPSIGIADRLESITASVKWLKTNPAPDLIMLDIQLADGQSFEIFRQVRVESFIIFTTAYDEYAIRAFELNSIDYLLKPVDSDKLQRSLEKFKKLRQAGTGIRLEEILTFLDKQQRQYKKRFLVSAGAGIRSVESEDAAWFVSTDKATFLCTRDNIWYPVEYSLENLESILDPDRFFRISRQYIVSFDAIGKIHVLSKSRIRLGIKPSPGDDVVVSTARTHEFRKWLDR